MQSIRNLRFYYALTLALTLVATVLRALALTLSLDRASGYFEAGAALPLVSRIVTLLAVAALLCYPFALRDRVPTAAAPENRTTETSAVLCAFLFFITFISTCTAKGAVALPTLLWLVGLFTLLAAVVYFLTKTRFCRVGELATAVLGSLSLLALACLITVTYFDIATPMNAPAKVSLHLALLAVMLFLLYELRDAVGTPMPRARVATTALGFFATATVGLSNLVALAAGIYHGSIYLVQSLLLVALAIYIAARGAAGLQMPLTAKERSKPTT